MAKIVLVFAPLLNGLTHSLQAQLFHMQFNNSQASADAALFDDLFILEKLMQFVLQPNFRYQQFNIGEFFVHNFFSWQRRTLRAAMFVS